MRTFSFPFGDLTVAFLLVCSCGTGLPDGQTFNPRSRASAAKSGNSTCADFCNNLPPGPLRGQCVSDAAHGLGLCPACGADFANVCGIPANPLPGQTDIVPFCPDFLTDNLNCGSCGNVCTGPGVTCGGGGTPGVCGCTPEPAAVTCNGHCGGTIEINNCGQPVTCDADCGICGYREEPYACNPHDCNCHFDLICGPPQHYSPGFFNCCNTCYDTCYATIPIPCSPH